MNSTFNLYAKYYDLLYRDKDYESESEYIIKLIDKFRPDSKTILDLGSGTGRHDLLLAEKGFNVTGIEISEIMSKEAERNKKNIRSDRKVKFVNGDIRNTRLHEKFDIVISLFHVMSYQISNKDLIKTFATAESHLKDDGIFIFDFWYGPAVLTERPESRVKYLENDELKIERYAEPFLKINENTVEVKYTVKAEDKTEGKFNEIKEIHSMRYFFIPELKLILNQLNMGIMHFEEWMTGNKLSDESWYALVIAGKRS